MEHSSKVKILLYSQERALENSIIVNVRLQYPSKIHSNHILFRKLYPSYRLTYLHKDVYLDHI